MLSVSLATSPATRCHQVCPAESLLTSGVPSRVPPYIRCPQQSPSLHQVCPAESLLTSGVPSRVPPYTQCPQRSPSLHQVSPVESLLTSGVPSGVPPYITCPQQSPSLHQVSPVESLLTSRVPSGVLPYSIFPSSFTWGRLFFPAVPLLIQGKLRGQGGTAAFQTTSSQALVQGTALQDIGLLAKVSSVCPYDSRGHRRFSSSLEKQQTAEDHRSGWITPTRADVSV
ncbi:hypothetical protein AB205_0147610 [Aquarana catesbeiana]|uniref:Uncharacterized protein n=1 Tax=Aquarana catesbeiana TaxID=8400 RepID=A0A2G9RAN1_AQUCT|nr:hypothetical protein AB205_0147610 [Aquarana catesbeiana]